MVVADSTQFTQQQYPFSAIVRATRKYYGMTQGDFARAIGYKQNMLSEVENEINTPSIDFWARFCEVTGVEEESARVGFLSFKNRPHAPVLEPVSTPIEGFKIPEQYADTRGTSVNALRYVFSFLKQKTGFKGLEKFLASLGVDPDYFLILDHQISHKFWADLIDKAIAIGVLSVQDLKQILAPVALPWAHQIVKHRFDQCESAMDLLKTRINTVKQTYECNYKYSVVEEQREKGFLDFEVVAEPHVQHLLDSGDHARFMVEYRRVYFELFANRYKVGLATNVDVQRDGKTRWIYRTQINQN